MLQQNATQWTCSALSVLQSTVDNVFQPHCMVCFHPIYAFDHMLNIPRGQVLVNVFLNVNQPQAIHVNRYIRSEKVASYCAFMFSSYMFTLPAHYGSATSTPSSCHRFRTYIILGLCIIIFVFLFILYAYFHKL